jgi:PAS domain S-box-containing protein
MSELGLGTELASLARELELLRADADADAAAANGGVLAQTYEALRTSIEQLRVADELHARQAEELERARRRLALERERYAELFDFAPDAYLVTDLAGVVMEANRGAGALLAVTPRFLVGKPLATYLDLEDRRAFRRRLLELAELRAREQFDVRLFRRGGVPFDCAMTVAPARDVSGALVGIRWMLRDVTEQKQVEERLWELNAELERRVGERTSELERTLGELQEERERFETVLRRMPAGVIMCEAPTGRVVFANDELVRLLGGPLSIRRIAEWSRFDGFRPDGRRYEPEEWPLARSIRDGEVVDGEQIELRRDDGSSVLIEASSTPVRNVDGEIVSGVAAFQDVTERDRRERAEREFVTNAAHELRTPLTAITSAVEVLQRGAKDEPAERDRFLGHIEREAARLVRLSRALLVLARAQTTAEQPRIELVELAPLLRETAAGVKTAEGVELDVQCASDVAVLVDRDLAEQALVNLVSNAARYTSEGRIEIDVTRPSDGLVAIEVRDTGSGIPLEHASQVFDRFYRGGERGGDGFGLGLAIARQAVEALGGTVELVSRPGAGTRARVTLTAARVVPS